jgi:aminopeptidase N
MAHPVRPQSYEEIRNFYTMTVYEKGAEVVRMQHTLLGEEKFRAGMDLYFKRHDGQAVTCDDFVQAMQDASKIDLGQFKRWYDVAGTPVLECTSDYDPKLQTWTLAVKQSMSPPFHIPLAVALLDPDGREVRDSARMLQVKADTQRFVFTGVAQRPVPSLLRGFTAPVILKYAHTEADLAHLLAHDRDPFNRWEAAQQLAAGIILAGNGAPGATYIASLQELLRDKDHAFVAECLSLPSETFLAEQMDVVDPDALHAARNRLRREIAVFLREDFLSCYEKLKTPPPYSPDPVSAGKRALRNLILAYLSDLDGPALAARQFREADNMADSMAALTCLANLDAAERVAALQAFYERWKDEPLVVDKWLAVQAGSRLPIALSEVQKLLQHPAFDLRVPNKVYALIRGFSANHVRFHAADGAGYAFLADRVLALDRLNPQVAARMARGFDRWKRFDENRRAKSREQLARIRDAKGISRDVAEIVTKALA